MLTETEINSAYENMRRAEEARYEAAEEEIQARMMCESLKAIEVKFRKPDWQEEFNKREAAWWEAEHNQRVAIHMHRMAKWEILKNRDILDLVQFGEDRESISGDESYNDSDIVARNLKSIKVPKRKTIWGQ